MEPLYEDKEWLQYQYIDLKKTTTQIAKECEVKDINVGYYLRKFNIPRRPSAKGIGMLGRHHSKKSKRQIGKEIKCNWNNPEYKKRQKIAMNRPGVREKRSGENSVLWKENYEELGYDGKHIRMHKKLAGMGISKPEICPKCNIKPKTKKQMHLMNIDHKYRNIPNEWFYMCSHCHEGIYDCLAGLRINNNIKPIPNLIQKILSLETREEREKLLKEVILNVKK